MRGRVTESAPAHPLIRFAAGFAVDDLSPPPDPPRALAKPQRDSGADRGLAPHRPRGGPPCSQRGSESEDLWGGLWSLPGMTGPTVGVMFSAMTYMVEIRQDGRAYVVDLNGKAARNRAGHVMRFRDHRTAREIAADLSRHVVRATTLQVAA